MLCPTFASADVNEPRVWWLLEHAWEAPPDEQSLSSFSASTWTASASTSTASSAVQVSDTRAREDDSEHSFGGLGGVGADSSARLRVTLAGRGYRSSSCPT
jgi:hypothetical protein